MPEPTPPSPHDTPPPRLIPTAENSSEPTPLLPSLASPSSGASFLREHRARRMRDVFNMPTVAIDAGISPDDDSEHDLPPSEPRALPKTTRDFEVAGEWAPIRVSDCASAQDLEAWPLRPQRFVDGKDVGRTVAWLQDSSGHPIPLRLSIVGGIAVENCGGDLKRRACLAEKALTMVTECFDIERVSAFRDALAARGIALHSVPCPKEGAGFEWERTAGRTRAESRRRMIELEREVMGLGDGVPTLVDGRLDVHLVGEDAYKIAPVIGLIKSHHVEYFEGESSAWRTLYALEPGERTPAFVVQARSANQDTVSWYVRLCGSGGEMPSSGVVRVEVARQFFESHCGFDSLDKWSRLICDYRCRDERYARASISIHPIVRAEELLGAVFPPLEKTITSFYRAFGL